MSRLFYEKSVYYKGYLIIPFILSVANGESIYSYKLLSEFGHKGKLHKLGNPGGIYSNSNDSIIGIAKEYLDKNSEVVTDIDYFKCRYTYQNNLIIVHEVAGKYFYDHYKPEELSNVAAPKLFNSESECISWIKQGLDRPFRSEKAEKI